MSYATNCALGVAVGLGLDTRGNRWLHHALYSSTVTLTALAAATALTRRPQRTSITAHSERDALLAPAVGALAALAVVPAANSRSRWHPLVSLAALPFFVAGLVRAAG